MTAAESVGRVGAQRRIETPDATTLAALAGEHLDLVRAPFTLPRSRVLVFREGDGVRVHTSEYERTLAECRVLDSLVVRDASGGPLAITRVLPHVIEFGGGVDLTFAGPGALTVGRVAAPEAMRIETSDEGLDTHAGARSSTGGSGSTGVTVEWTTPDGVLTRVELDDDTAAVRLDIGADRMVRHEASGTHLADLAATEAIWLDWFARCPVVRSDLQSMTAFCWWVLGANIVELPALGNARAVVPSKIGYVGLWQWDAYFIAVGLRHGDPALAREQLEIAFRFPSGDGQLPDVVHEHGVLATSDDLPPGDRENLRRAGSAVADPSAPVPLTKPPLAAWALAKVLDVEAADEWGRRQLATIRRSQDWWFAASDLDGDGLPEYGHPYSSGLDDSPIFDGPLPTTSPDLGAYLVLQDLELARFADCFGDADAAAHRLRAERTFGLLMELWDDELGLFAARAAGAEVVSDTVVGLMPLLTGSLPEAIVDRLVAALADERRFAAAWAVPTVALDDPDFSPERMWRGPVWVNTNALVVEGLRASGRIGLARDLAERTVALVMHGGGPHEYFNPLTGEKAATATTAFGWSAALFVDLAVELSSETTSVE
ncbi:amylo-alpha-1,6-glucosidase [Agromyces neolithicus]|uniref:Mannosylglycerate hydrolase MGH1-like glycoside hydrolase domain-containing protein n=1 Tax=Agromyces neolithicus TaxID=269420 RepID=A0ABP4YA28_9MICO